MTVGCRIFSGSKEPFRASAGFQFVLLGLRVPAVAYLLSVLFRLSSSCVISLFPTGVDGCCNFANSSNLDLSFSPAQSGQEAKLASTAAVGGAGSSSTSSAEDPEDRLHI
jgi:hypothetical protein